MLCALFQKHSTHISMRECAAVSLSLDCHRLQAANNRAVNRKGEQIKGKAGEHQVVTNAAMTEHCTRKKRRYRPHFVEVIFFFFEAACGKAIRAEVDVRQKHSRERRPNGQIRGPPLTPPSNSHNLAQSFTGWILSLFLLLKLHCKVCVRSYTS